MLKLKRRYLVTTLLLLVIWLMPLSANEAKLDEYARTIAQQQVDIQKLTFEKNNKQSENDMLKERIETKDMVIKEKGDELFWSRITTIVVCVVIIIGSF
jgi:peptidoglycan hydrolase CwlO-like protein